jgi:dihydroflavonol-4-reductase
VTRVLVTGASGLIGGALAERLSQRGDDVVALARSEAAGAALRERGLDVAGGDILDERAVTAAARECALVFHVAGVNAFCPPDPAMLLRVNVAGAAAVVRAAAGAGVPRVVLTSSAAALGEEHGTVGREDSPHRGSYMSLYERSKREGEDAAFAAARETGIDLVAVNPSSVQGPGRAGGTGRILIAYLNGRLPAFVDTHLSLVDLADCVQGHVLAAERGRPGERYILSGATLGALEALGIVSGLTGIEDRPRLLPPAVATAAAAVLEAAARLARRRPPVCREMVRTMLHGHRYDGSRATRELGLDYTPVRETLARTIAWAVAEGLVTRPLPAWPADASRASAAGTSEGHR